MGTFTCSICQHAIDQILLVAKNFFFYSRTSQRLPRNQEYVQTSSCIQFQLKEKYFQNNIFMEKRTKYQLKEKEEEIRNNRKKKEEKRKEKKKNKEFSLFYSICWSNGIQIKIFICKSSICIME